MNGRIVVFNGPRTDFTVREYPVADPGPDEILVKVTQACVCGSDLHMWRGETPPFQKPPGVPGHEMTGIIAKLGRDRHTDTLGRPLKEGDRVAYAYFIPCGSCWACLSGTTGCPNRYRLRAALTVEDPPHFHGAYADYYYLLPRQWVYKVPDELPDDLVAPVNCALSQVVYGLHRIGIWLGDTVVIQGAGGLGINAIAVARDMGAGRIIAVDAVPERLALARAFGADAMIDLREIPNRADRVARVKELTGGVGADVCVEVAGVANVVQEGLEMLRVGGRYLMMGNIVPGAAAEIVPHDAVRQPKNLLGVLAYDAWVIPRAMDWLTRARHRFPFDRLVAGRYPLEQVNQAFQEADWAAKAGQVPRAILTC
ncbi:MAG TPA: zinc-binding dehydrogenase [Chloroflexota bacterium]|nr:zinc-binding dehydrogenase [Chloroflexota bacterium]